MADLTNRYPIATADGKSIPHEVLRPKGFYRLDLSTTASGIITLAAGTKILVLISTVDCILKFHATVAASVPAVGSLLADAMFLPKNTIQTISPDVAAVSGITIAGTGTVYITLAGAWSGLGLEHQYNRR